jgi:hypothetical protein
VIEALKQRVNDDEALVRRGQYLTTTLLLEVGPTAWLILRYFKEALAKLRPQKTAQEALQETTQGSAEGAAA